jgi:hypothetical protein
VTVVRRMRWILGGGGARKPHSRMRIGVRRELRRSRAAAALVKPVGVESARSGTTCRWQGVALAAEAAAGALLLAAGWAQNEALLLLAVLRPVAARAAAAAGGVAAASALVVHVAAGRSM